MMSPLPDVLALSNQSMCFKSPLHLLIFPFCSLSHLHVIRLLSSASHARWDHISGLQQAGDITYKHPNMINFEFRFYHEIKETQNKYFWMWFGGKSSYSPEWYVDYLRMLFPPSVIHTNSSVFIFKILYYLTKRDHVEKPKCVESRNSYNKQ